MKKKRIIVCDLDGTLSNSSHRDHLAQNKEWEEFHRKCSEDDPFEDVAQLIKAMNNSGFITIALTGRSDNYRIRTEDWLNFHGIGFDSVLMRPDGDWTSDVELKPRLLKDELEHWGQSFDDVLFVLEDRDKVVEAWRKLGLRCYQVALGGY